MQNIAILGSEGRSIVNFRGAFLRALISRGHRVTVLAPEGGPEFRTAIEEIGAVYVPVRMERAGINPFRDARTFIQFRQILRTIAPDVVFASAIKPIVYGIPAAGPRVRARYALITGLGAAFFVPGARGAVMRRVASMLYRNALRSCTTIFVQNREIGRILVRNRITRDERRIVLVPGSGIDTRRFAMTPMPTVSYPVFVMVARILKDKGVLEYMQAAEVLHEKHPYWQFKLVGTHDVNPAAVSPEVMREYIGRGIIDHVGYVDDVRPILGASTVFVLPSYHEGLPRSVLEAMAVGRAVVTTDAIGCRETIFTERVRVVRDWGIEGDNGVLVRCRSADSLCGGMAYLGSNFRLAAEMGRRGRVIAESRFDVRIVNEAMIQSMAL